ncbi:hypothetical protein Gpo141_00012761 [Globisporangium polare]
MKRVHVEVCVKQASVAEYKLVRDAVLDFLFNHGNTFKPGAVAFEEEPFLAEHVQSIAIPDLDENDDNDFEGGDGIPYSAAEPAIHVFKISDEPMAEQTTEDDENVSTCHELTLPSLSLHGLWETLIYDNAVKRNLLDYATTAMLFSDSKVNPHIISWNR